MSPIVITQYVVYLFQFDLCDANYVGCTARRMHRHISEHKNSPIGKHLVTQHRLDKKAPINHLFKVLKKYRSKFECLVYEMLFIKDIRPTLYIQTDSISAELFI